MSSTFRLTCATCGFESRPRVGADLQLLVTDADEDERRRAGEVVPALYHPLTGYVLDEFGLSFASAAWGGRLVAVRGAVCRGCGHTFDRRRLTAGGARVGCGGCLGLAAVGVLVSMTAGVLVGNPFIGLGVGGLVTVTTLAVIELGAGAIVRGWYPGRVAAVDGPDACPACAGTDIARLDTRPARLSCPQCGSAARVEPG